MLIPAVVFLALLPLFVVADWWDDFANNLATDLGPVIALFGEAPTKQFLSESLTYLDYFIFAMAPLGILTAVVSAIRVRGGSSLRAFIGRSQEGMGTIEAELCSSTSRDVCELYNNGGISRMIGRPRVLEVVYDPTADEYDSDGKETMTLYSVQEYFERNASGDGKRKWVEMVPRLGGILPDSPAEHPGKGGDLEARSSSYEQANTPKLFAPSPNLTLNVWMKKVPTVANYAAAAAGVVVQGGVLVLGAVLTYYLGLSREDSAVSQYGFPLTACGTVMLSAGVFLCAFLVGESTSERKFQQVNDEIGPGQQRGPKFAWLQPGGQRVGDQEFDAFAYTDRPEQYTTSWKASSNAIDAFARPADKTVPSRSQAAGGPMVFCAVALCVVGFICQFVGLRDIHPSVSMAQLAATLIMSFVRSLLRTQRLSPSKNLLEGVSDFVHGHELDWLALHLASRDNAPEDDATANKQTEAEVEYRPLWVVTGWSERFVSPGHDQSHVDISNSRHYVRCAWDSSSFLLHDDSDWNWGRKLVQASLNREGEERVRVFGSLAEVSWILSEREISPNKLSLTKRAFSLRKQLAKLTGQAASRPGSDLKVPASMQNWTADQIPIRGLAVQLASAIERVANTLFASDTIFKGRWRDSLSFYWAVPSSAIQRGYEPAPIYFSIRRTSNRGPWAADPIALEAALGLWSWSLRADARTDSRDESTGQRISGAEEITKYRIISTNINNETVWGLDHLDALMWLGVHGLHKHGLPSASTLYSPKTPGHIHGSHDLFEDNPYTTISLHSGLPSKLGNGPNVRLSCQRFFGWYAMPHLHALPHAWSSYSFQPHRVDAPIPLVCAQEIFGFSLQALFLIVDRLGGTFRHAMPGTSTSPILANDMVSEVVAIFRDSHLGSEEDSLLTILPAIGTRQLSTYEGFIRAIRRDVKNLRLSSQWGRGATLLHETVEYTWRCPEPSTPTWSRSAPPNLARSVLHYMHHIFLGQHENPKPDLPELKNMHVGWPWLQDRSKQGFSTLLELRDEYIQALSTNDPSEDTALSERPRVAGILRSLAIRKPLPLYRILRGLDAANDLVDEFLTLVVERALELGTNVSARDEAGKTALAIAAEKGMSKVVAILLEGGSVPELRDDDNMTALHHAARNGNLGVAQLLLWAKSDYTSERMVDKNGLTPLLHAARNSHGSITNFVIAYAGNADIMRDELDFLVNAELREDEQVAALKHFGTLWPELKSSTPRDHPFVACLERKKFRLATEFITSNVIGFDYQASIRASELFLAEIGFLPLAARSGNRQVVERLLEKHADIIPILEFGFAMVFAAMGGYTDILQLLIENERVKEDTVEENIKRARQDAELLVATQMVTINSHADDEHMNPLMFAVKYGQLGMVSFLAGIRLRGVQATVEGVELYEEGREPLLALAVGCVDNVIGQLRRANESPVSDGHADSIVDEAKARAENILKQLLGFFWGDKRLLGLMLDWQDADQQTALMIAVKKGLESGVGALLVSGADISLTNKEGKTARQIAEESGNQKMIAFFDEAAAEKKTSWSRLNFFQQGQPRYIH
jgi:ankyrin repeat protein